MDVRNSNKKSNGSKIAKSRDKVVSHVTRRPGARAKGAGGTALARYSLQPEQLVPESLT